MKPWELASGLLAVLAMVVGCVGAGATPCQLAINSKLPLLPNGLIEARINGAPARMILDTGAFTSVLTDTASRRLRLRVDPDVSESFRGIAREPWMLQGIGGARMGEEVLTNSFELGGLVGHHFHFLTAGFSLGDADGLLSTDFLADYDVDLDFAGNEIRLYRQLGDCDRPKILLAPPVYATKLLSQSYDRLPRVEAFIGDRRLVALIDTGADHSAMYRNVAAQLGLVPNAPVLAKAVKVHGIGPDEVSAVTHVFPAVTIGDLTFRNMRVQIMDQRSNDDIDMILGVDFQRKTHVWISNSAHLLVMQYPPKASPE